MEQDKHQRLQELFLQRKQLRDLVLTPGWGLVMLAVEQQTRLRRIGLFQTDIIDLSSCFTMARVQGEVSGLQILRVLVDTLIADFDATIGAIQTELEESERKIEDGNDGS
jgi:hypothetical protein